VSLEKELGKEGVRLPRERLLGAVSVMDIDIEYRYFQASELGHTGGECRI
jgi:hypothetical protein